MGDSTNNYPRYGGVIAGLNEQGYGFIQSGEGESDIFFHSNELINVRFDDLRIGDKVGFDAVQINNGFAAANIGKNGSSQPFRRYVESDIEEVEPPEIEEVEPPEIEEDTLSEDLLDGPIFGSVEYAVEKLSQELAKIIAYDPDQIERVEWRHLEGVIAETLKGLGFDVHPTPPSKDGGKDVVITQRGELGTKSYFIELKHWKTKVGPGPVQEFLHVVARDKQTGGLFLSTNGFTSKVLETYTEIERKRVRLGTKHKIVTMCKNYVRRLSGLWQPPRKIEEVLFDDTI